MQQCPGCHRSAKTSERIETDRRTKKNWLITYCAKCGFNYSLEEYKGKVMSPEEEMNQYPWPPTSGSKYWPTI